MWYQQWYPRVKEANGHRYLNASGRCKRSSSCSYRDMTYLIYRDLHYPLGKWSQEVQNVRNNFAERNALPLRKKQLQWDEVE